MLRQFQTALSIWIAVSSCAAGATIDLAAELLPHLSRWSYADGVWRTTGERLAGGWYLRGKRQYDLQELQLRLQRSSESGLVTIYLRDWRIALRPDSVTTKYAEQWKPPRPPGRYWTHYQYSCTRPVAFTAGTWHDVAVRLDGHSIAVQFDGREVLRYTSPAAEWDEKTAASNKPAIQIYRHPEQMPPGAFDGKKEVVVIHAFDTPVAIRQARLIGRDVGEAEGFGTMAFVSPFKLDTELDRIATFKPKRIRGRLRKTERQKAVDLPAVTTWKIEPVNVKEHWGDKVNNPARRVEVRMGAEDEGKFPNGLQFYERSYLFGSTHMPQEASIYFNLAKAGTYTLKTDFGSMFWHSAGWGPSTLEIYVDGEIVSRDVYRGHYQTVVTCPVFEYVPLELAAGPHRVDYRFTVDLFGPGFSAKFARVTFKNIELVTGAVEPILEYAAGSTPNGGVLAQRPQALQAAPTVGYRYGKILRYRITDLQEGQPYQVVLGFQELEVSKPGQRVMEVSINGKTVADNLDLVDEGYRTRYVEKRFAVEPAPAKTKDGRSTHAVDIRILGKTFKAFLNRVTVVDAGGREVFTENCGWHPYLETRFQPPAYAPRWDARPMYADPKKNPLPKENNGYFDGHNMIANPGMDHADDRGKPTWWYSLQDQKADYERPYPETLRQKFLENYPEQWKNKLEYPSFFQHYQIRVGEGDYAHDAIVGHDQPGSLRIGKTDSDFGITSTWPLIDYGKRQTYSFYVKTERATGRVVPELLWFRCDSLADAKWMDYDGGGLKTPKMQLIGSAEGEPVVPGTGDWTRVEISAQPPLGTVYVAPVIRVENNTAGTVWVDDAEWNGYGADPLEILYSHPGYHPQSTKLVVVRSFNKSPVTWELLDAKTDQVVRSGTAKYHSDEWFSKRHFHRFDLSEFRTPGRYRLRATQGDNRVTSRTWPIARDTYHRVAAVTLDGLWGKRYQCDLPGMHEPTSVEDANMMVAIEDDRFYHEEQVVSEDRVDMEGGYFDAGDEVKYIRYWPSAMMATLTMDRFLTEPIQHRTTDDVDDELRWAWDSLHKVADQHGAIYSTVRPQGHESDNVPGYAKDRVAYAPMALPQVAGLSAMGSHDLRGRYPRLAAIYLDLAKRNYATNWAAWQRTFKPKPDDPVSAKNAFLFASKALFAEMYLWPLTGEELYLQRMNEHAPIVAKGIEEALWAGNLEVYGANNKSGSLMMEFTWVSCRFAAMYPDHPATPALKNALRSFAERVNAASAIEPYGQARDINHENPQEAPRFMSYYGVGYWEGLAHALAEIGMLLDEPRYIHLAERQLQWLLGTNFADLCMLHGVSDRVVAGGDKIMQQAEFFRAWLESDKTLMYYNGMVPTMSMRGVGDGKIKRGQADYETPPITGHPRGWCVMHPQPNYAYAPGPTEYYLPNTAHLATAAAAVHAALESLVK